MMKTQSLVEVAKTTKRKMSALTFDSKLLERMELIRSKFKKSTQKLRFMSTENDLNVAVLILAMSTLKTLFSLSTLIKKSQYL